MKKFMLLALIIIAATFTVSAEPEPAATDPASPPAATEPASAQPAIEPALTAGATAAAEPAAPPAAVEPTVPTPGNAPAPVAPAKPKVVSPVIENPVTWYYRAKLWRRGFRPEDLDVHSIPQSHIDAAWRWRLSQTHRKVYRTWSQALEYMETRPEYTFSGSAPQYYEWLLQDHPDVFAEIVKREKEGRWEIVGGSWIEPDGNIPDGESYCRQRLEASVSTLNISATSPPSSGCSTPSDITATSRRSSPVPAPNICGPPSSSGTARPSSPSITSPGVALTAPRC
jgi:hypothetical protein